MTAHGNSPLSPPPRVPTLVFATLREPPPATPYPATLASSRFGKSLRGHTYATPRVFFQHPFLHWPTSLRKARSMRYAPIPAAESAARPIAIEPRLPCTNRFRQPAQNNGLISFVTFGIKPTSASFQTLYVHRSTPRGVGFVSRNNGLAARGLSLCHSKTRGLQAPVTRVVSKPRNLCNLWTACPKQKGRLDISSRPLCISFFAFRCCPAFRSVTGCGARGCRPSGSRHRDHDGGCSDGT